MNETQLKQAQDRLAELRALREAAATPGGKVILAALSKLTGADKSCFRESAHGMSYVVGLRDAYVLLTEKIEGDLADRLEKQIAEILAHKKDEESEGENE